MELTSQSNQFVLTERCQTVGLLNVWKRNSKNILMETRDRAESKYKRAFMNCFSVLLDLDVKDSEGRYIEFFQSGRDFNIFKNFRKGRTDLQEVAKRIPECPICFEKFRGGYEVFQCGQGHFICGKCRPQVQSCPRCRSGLIGRCHDFEHFLQSLNI